jgi:NinB protein
LNQQNLNNLFEKIKALDFTKRWKVNISEEKTVRSLEQNERLWALYGSVANYTGEDPTTIHQLMGYKFLRYQAEIAGNAVELVRSTTKLDSKQMADYQNSIEIWATQLGWSFE